MRAALDATRDGGAPDGAPALNNAGDWPDAAPALTELPERDMTFARFAARARPTRRTSWRLRHDIVQSGDVPKLHGCLRSERAATRPHDRRTGRLRHDGLHHRAAATACGANGKQWFGFNNNAPGGVKPVTAAAAHQTTVLSAEGGLGARCRRAARVSLPRPRDLAAVTLAVCTLGTDIRVHDFAGRCANICSRSSPAPWQPLPSDTTACTRTSGMRQRPCNSGVESGRTRGDAPP
eukprot:scaffold15702_cov66-Phaeocystis_antarctica.AAC.16